MLYQSVCNKTLLNRFLRVVICLIASITLSSCGLFHSDKTVKDSAPTYQVNPDEILDATPRVDKVTRAGNKNPYTVLGKTYHLLPTSEGYKEKGVASWYGKKFHGRPTANGEPYNLYGMTAAHKTLPIPAYVKVTNLNNNRTAVVRVNDRGPFHSDRIIDLSYAAAVKLGFAEHGTAPVFVEVITPKKIVSPAAKPIQSFESNISETAASERYFLQVGAFKNLASANNLRADLVSKTGRGVLVKPNEQQDIYRVQLGPLTSLSQVEQVSQELKALNIEQPRLITE